jgi:hypothetical protein
MKTKDIPADWKPWIEITGNYIRMEKTIKLGRNKEERLLIALCLTATEYFTKKESVAGLCVYKDLYHNESCANCPLSYKGYASGCVGRSHRGDGMRLYAKALKEFSR